MTLTVRGARFARGTRVRRTLAATLTALVLLTTVRASAQQASGGSGDTVEDKYAAARQLRNTGGVAILGGILLAGLGAAAVVTTNYDSDDGQVITGLGFLSLGGLFTIGGAIMAPVGQVRMWYWEGMGAKGVSVTFAPPPAGSMGGGLRLDF